MLPQGRTGTSILTGTTHTERSEEKQAKLSPKAIRNRSLEPPPPLRNSMVGMSMKEGKKVEY